MGGVYNKRMYMYIDMYFLFFSLQGPWNFYFAFMYLWVQTMGRVTETKSAAILIRATSGCQCNNPSEDKLLMETLMLKFSLVTFDLSPSKPIGQASTVFIGSGLDVLASAWVKSPESTHRRASWQVCVTRSSWRGRVHHFTWLWDRPTDRPSSPSPSCSTLIQPTTQTVWVGVEELPWTFLSLFYNIEWNVNKKKSKWKLTSTLIKLTESTQKRQNKKSVI